MRDYEDVKNWFVDKDNQKKLVVGIGFVVVFLVGFGSGRYERASARSKLPTNYNSSAAKKPDTAAPKAEAAAPVAPVGEQGKVEAATTKAPAPAVDTQNCPVKGNISSSKKIYHVPGGVFYKTVKPEQCFATEAEAQAAGFVKSQR